MPADGVVVRDATQRDLAPIAAIYAHYVATSLATFDHTPLTTAGWRQRFDEVAARGLPFLVAERTGAGGGTLGYAYCSPWRRWPAYQHTVEDSVYVAPAAAGQGLGGALLRELLRRCADAGVRQVVAVIADTGDPTSAALHRRCGFVEVGRLTGVGAKHGRRLDTLLMQRALDGARPARREPLGTSGPA